jgi:hypothetical protein
MSGQAIDEAEEILELGARLHCDHYFHTDE